MKLQMLKRALIAYVSNSVKAIWSAVAHPLTIVGNKNGNVKDYKIYGNTVRDGTPTLDNPIEVKSVGDYDEESGKYKLPIAVKGEKNTETVNMQLDEPLMSMSYAGKKCVDYIDSVENVVIKYCYQEVYNGTESWEVRDTSYPNTFSKRITQARNVVCSHYKTSSSNMVDNTIAANNSIRVYITDSRFATVDEFKAYLAQQAEAGTPVTAVFLSITAYNGSPTVTSIELPKLPQFKGTTVYEMLTDAPPSGIEVQYYG